MRYPEFTLVSVLLFGLTLIHTPPARALSCAGSMVGLLSPNPRQPAPRNAHVWVQLFGISGARSMKKRQITLRKKNGPVVPTTREVVGSAMVRVVHLTPKAPLAANTRYVVLQQEPKGKPGVIREFTTGSSMDEESPRMLVRGIRYVDAMVTDGWNPGKRRSQTYALDFSAEVSPEDFGLYGIWLAENKQDIDFAKPPLTYIQHRGGALEFGQPASACPYDTLTLPENPTKQFIGIRLWDSAGNSSPPKVLQATPE